MNERKFSILKVSANGKIEMKDGVYISQYGKLKVLTTDPNLKSQFLDEGLKVKHPILRIIQPIVREASIGWPWADTYLKNCEYLGEL